MSKPSSFSIPLAGLSKEASEASPHGQPSPLWGGQVRTNTQASVTACSDRRTHSSPFTRP